MEIKQKFEKELRVVIRRIDLTEWLSSACDNYSAIEDEIEEENLEVNFNIQPEHTDADEKKGDLVVYGTPSYYEENESNGTNSNDKSMNNECKDCGISFHYKKDCIDHAHKKHGIVPAQKLRRFACHLCSFKSAVEIQYKAHMKYHEENWTQDFQCVHCDETLRPHTFLAHLKIHSDGKKLVCVFCDKQFLYKEGIDNHLLTHHGDKDIDGYISRRILNCDQCSYRIARSDLMKYHLQIKHKTIQEKFYCHNCDFSTDHKSSLKTHMMRHMKSIICRYCNKILSNNQALNRHMSNKHFNKADIEDTITAKLHRCHVCPHITTDINMHERHILSKHNIKPNRELLRCKHCSYTTYFRLSMNNHSVLHTGKRHECKRCGKKVAQKIGLDAHIYNCHREDEEMLKTITNKIFTCKYCLQYTAIGTNPIKFHMKACKRKMKSKI